MKVTGSGTLELVERPTAQAGVDDVRIQVEACGVCGADAADITGADPTLQPPRVPGHEVVGRIVALGSNVPALWKVGRSEERRVGKECVSTCRCRWSPEHEKKKTKKTKPGESVTKGRNTKRQGR